MERNRRKPFFEDGSRRTIYLAEKRRGMAGAPEADLDAADSGE
jgi:hypothetical protein